MSLSKDQIRRAHIALNRFGLGAKPGVITKIAKDAKAAVLAELNTKNIATIAQGTLPTYKQACQAVHTSFSAEHGFKERELSARISKHRSVQIGFVERLVLFFSNHFSTSINKDGAIRATIGQLERDVIRKHVLGSFASMLIGVMKHPAMIAYLDNGDSIGPNSPIGISWGAGHNQNLAREALELHTLGVGGGYSEQDVDNFAKVLTGWSFVRGWEADNNYNGGNASNRGQFIFRTSWHEPGAQHILGKVYAQSGIKQGEAVLKALATHRSTAQFLAFKLVRHFITDSPTPELVNPVAKAFTASRGNLKATAKALVNLNKAWTLPLKKLRTPYELQIAEMRAMGRAYPADGRWPFDATLSALRHMPWERGAPDGYSDESAYWMGPDAMRIRLETAQMNAWTLSQIAPFNDSGPGLAGKLFSKALSGPSRTAIAAAPNIYDGLTTLFMVPEFQRR
jgi:uncharacterized protein (DUF1800 family)